jgi:hypothetical protein
LRVSENGALRKWQEYEEDCIMRSFTTCTLQKILLEYPSQGE